MYKIDKYLARLSKKREKAQITKIRNDSGSLMTVHKEKRLLRETLKATVCPQIN